MNELKFSFNGRPVQFNATTLLDLVPPRGIETVAAHARPDPHLTMAQEAMQLVRDSDQTAGMNRLGAFGETTIPFVVENANVVTIATACVIISGPDRTRIKRETDWLKKNRGMTVNEEGRTGITLLRAPSDGIDGVNEAFAAVDVAANRKIAIVQPNFLRIRAHRRIDPPTAAGPAAEAMAPALPWNLQIVHAPGAWQITQGVASIRVAVLDEGGDPAHDFLKPAVVDEKDFIGTQSNAHPERDDAHGTACAGIVLSRDSQSPGLAPKVSLVAARIGRSNPNVPHQWIFDDFKTADAIDWCWKDAKADVLSNSWNGGLPSDAVRLAFERARTQGRGGKGCVIVIAAGNLQTAIPFPGTLANVLVVGATNQWDERKTKTSRDGEFWWGSNFGPTLSLMAPGVKINTTDITGSHGYSTGDSTDSFNGTSAATPHVAAAAALILSVDKDKQESQVRSLLTNSCDPMTGPATEVGRGRLNVERALQSISAPQAPAGPSSAARPKKRATRSKPGATRKKAASRSAKKVAKANPRKTTKKPPKKFATRKSSAKKAVAAAKRTKSSKGGARKKSRLPKSKKKK